MIAGSSWLELAWTLPGLCIGQSTNGSWSHLEVLGWLTPDLNCDTAASPASSVNQIVAMLNKHNQADQHEAAANEVRLYSTSVLPVRRLWLEMHLHAAWASSLHASSTGLSALLHEDPNQCSPAVNMAFYMSRCSAEACPKQGPQGDVRSSCHCGAPRWWGLAPVMRACLGLLYLVG